MDRLAELRERRGLTLRELSRMSGVSPDTINQIELGHRKPRPSTLRKLARALDIDIEDFFSESEELAPPKAEPFSLDWTRAASDAEFYRRTMTAPDEDTDRLDKLSGELSSFLGRPMRRILTGLNAKPFTDSGPEPTRAEEERLKERAAALRAELSRRRPPIAWLRMSDEGNVCRWNIPPDEWEEHRERIDKWFGDEKYDDVDAREDPQVHEVPLYAHA